MENQKRGPGRPRKSDAAIQSEPLKRGLGRPRASGAVEDTKNVTMHTDAAQSLQRVRTKMSRQFGFDLTVTQTMKALVKFYEDHQNG
jgi:hypothetical protein